MKDTQQPCCGSCDHGKARQQHLIICDLKEERHFIQGGGHAPARILPTFHCEDFKPKENAH